MRAFRSRLTTRGTLVLIVGIALATGAYSLRDPVLLWPGLFLMLLALLSLVSVVVGRPVLTIERTLDPPEATAREQLTVDLAVTERRLALTGSLRIEDRVPRSFGSARPFWMSLRGAGHTAHAHYDVRPMRRGRYLLDDLAYSHGDPLGLATRDARGEGATPVVVLPRVVRLGAIGDTASGRTGETALPHLALSGPDDVLVREYRPRDDVRRIHWPSTARTGTLMVRREEQAWDPVAWILLDTRGSAYPHGEASFEWAVTLAASVGIELLSAGYRVRITDASRRTFDAQMSEQQAPEKALLRHLVDVHVGQQDSMADAVSRIGASGAEHLVVAVLGSLDASAAADLAVLRDGANRCWALYVSQDQSGTSATTPERLARGRLVESGWELVAVPVEGDAASAWRSLAGVGSHRP